MRARFCRKRMSVLAMAITSICIVSMILVSAYLSSTLRVVYHRVCLGSRGIVIRVVQLSDLHLHGFGSFERRVAEIVAKLKPDIVVMTGDYIDNPSDSIYLEKFIAYLRKCLGSIPIYASIGNWELQAGTENLVKKLFRRYGIELLVNEYRIATAKGMRIAVIGFDDYLWGSPNTSIVRELPKADLYIALVHEPAYAVALAEAGFSGIVFAGHCHGGQIKVFGKPLYLPPGCPSNLYEGMHRLNRTVIVVSRGIGTAVIPIRIGANPEIVVVDIEL